MDENSPKRVSPGVSDRLQLCLLSFLILFYELALIRYLGATIWNLGYFPNLVLLSVFVGMGLGFVYRYKINETFSRGLYLLAPVLFMLLLVFVYFCRPAVPGTTNWASTWGGDLYFSASIDSSAVSMSYYPFVACFLLVVGSFFCIGQRTAVLFERFAPLKAYSLNILGSCAGILVFMCFSAARVSAPYWFLLSVPVYFCCVRRPKHKATLLLPLLAFAAVFVVALREDTRTIELGRKQVTGPAVWSPYYKIQVTDSRHIYVNGVGHQEVYDADRLRKSFYLNPYEARQRKKLPAARTALIIGSGCGNDVAAALLNGVEQVDAVEIDPVIGQIGKRLHPLQPYGDPRVTLTINDGRLVLTNTEKKYDLIVFALADSIVKVSPVAQLRLENYLFTKEAIAKANELLTPDGSLVVYNFFRTDWLIKKIAAMISVGAGRVPYVFRSGGYAFFMADRTCEATGPDAAAGVEIPTDNWPFLYLQRRAITGTYAWAMVGYVIFVLVIMVPALWSRVATTTDSGTRMRLVCVAFALMGMAFMLLETKSVIQYSLLFGTTWLTNSLVFLGVLSLVLLANWLANWAPRRILLPCFALLIVSSLLLLFFPIGHLLQVRSMPLRFLMATGLMVSPIFFANLIFGIVFKSQPVAEHVFGWNIMGASVGGILEYTSMALGYRDLVVMVAACYALALVFLFLAGCVRQRAEPRTAR